MEWDSRTTAKRAEDWLRKHGWWLFSAGIVFNLAVLFCSMSALGRYDTDALSVSLTVLEIFIVVVAFGGFWMIRGAAITAARTGAREEVRQLAREGFFDDPAQKSMQVSTSGPTSQPDLSSAVPAEDADKDPAE